jgi:septum formation protein
MKKIVLASASARRDRILSDCGINHDVIISDAEEMKNKEFHVSGLVRINAENKAEKVKKSCPDSIIISADTLVAHEEDIIGKPSDEDEAMCLLKKFSGGTIEVYTGICVLDTGNGNKTIDHDKSVIWMDLPDPEDIERFFRLLGPYDKAGGFSIEGAGAMLFDNIEGSYFNILGLPVMKLKKMFKQIGLNILDYMNN